MATGRTGYTAPVNGDTFQPPADMAAIYAWFDSRIDFSVSTATALPTTGNFKGKQAITEDTGQLWWFNGTAWVAVGASNPFFTYYKTGAFNWSSTETDHTWDSSPVEGSLAGWTTTDRITFTCTRGGLWRISGQIASQANAASSANITVYLNGAAYRRFDGSTGNGGAFTSHGFDLVHPFAVGDTFKIRIQSASTLTGVVTDGAQTTFMTVEYRHA